VCRKDHNLAALEGNESRHRRLLADPTIAKHGSASTYLNWGCRCDPCRAAATAKSRTSRGSQPRVSKPKVARVSKPKVVEPTMRKGMVFPPASRPRPKAEPIGREWLAQKEEAAA
jgi:hypothetical protein